MPTPKKWGSNPTLPDPKSFAPGSHVWLDGKVVPATDVKLGLLTHTLHYGFGVFEGMRAYQQADGTSAIFRLREHIQRLLDGARILHIHVPFSLDQISQGCLDVLVHSRMPDAYLRPLLFIGEGRMGIYAPDNPVRVTVPVWKWGSYLGVEGQQHGIRTKISTFTRVGVNMNMPRGKVVGHYVNSILAKQEAIADGYEEAILLDDQGYCAEGSGENLFMVRHGTLVTPPLSAPILAGITRDSALTLARELGIPVAEEMFSRSDLYLADEAFFTGTAAEITPIREVDGRTVGEGRPGPITRRIMDRFFKVLRGEVRDHGEWRTVYRIER